MSADCDRELYSLTVLLPNKKESLCLEIKKWKTIGDLKIVLEEASGIPVDIQVIQQRNHDVALNWIPLENITRNSDTVKMLVEDSWSDLVAHLLESQVDSNFVQRLPVILDELTSDDEDFEEAFLALFICIARKHFDAVKAVIRYLADNYNRQAFRHKTASDKNIYHAIALSGDESFLELLEDYCQDEAGKLLLEVDENGLTPIKLAQNKHYENLAFKMRDILQTDVQKITRQPKKKLERDRQKQCFIPSINSLGTIEERYNELNLQAPNTDSYFVPTSPIPLANGSISMQFPWLSANDKRRRRISAGGKISVISDQTANGDEVDNDLEDKKERVRRSSLQQLVNVEAMRSRRLSKVEPSKICVVVEAPSLPSETVLTESDDKDTIQDDNDQTDFNPVAQAKNNIRMERPWNAWAQAKQKYDVSKDSTDEDENRKKSFEKWMKTKLKDNLNGKKKQKNVKNSKEDHSLTDSPEVNPTKKKLHQNWIIEHNKKDEIKRQKHLKSLKKNADIEREKHVKKEMAEKNFNVWLQRKYEISIEEEEKKYKRQMQTKPRSLPKISTPGIQ